MSACAINRASREKKHSKEVECVHERTLALRVVGHLPVCARMVAVCDIEDRQQKLRFFLAVVK